MLEAQQNEHIRVLAEQQSHLIQAAGQLGEKQDAKARELESNQRVLAAGMEAVAGEHSRNMSALGHGMAQAHLATGAELRAGVESQARGVEGMIAQQAE